MLAQVLLIPTESKKLIAKATARADEIQNAFKKGIVALHPSTSTIFIVEELMRKQPDTDVWICGINCPEGAWVSVEAAAQIMEKDNAGKGRIHTPGSFAHTWVIEKGELKCGITLDDLLEKMGPNDVYIKGVNAVDTNNTVGVLIGNKVEGGTIGLVMSHAKRRGFKLVFPVGLEKLIPVPMAQAAEAAATRNLLDYCMGMPCALLPCEGITITETKAIEILSGATAIPISAGGLAGAEGAITMVIKGDKEQVTKAIEFIEEVKGAKLPRDVRVMVDAKAQPWR